MPNPIIISIILKNEKSNMLTIYERTVIYMLSGFLGKNETCWPSHKELCRVCHISKNTLIRTLKSLERKKYYLYKEKS